MVRKQLRQVITPLEVSEEVLEAFQQRLKVAVRMDSFQLGVDTAEI
jgi:hypothetical protein